MPTSCFVKVEPSTRLFRCVGCMSFKRAALQRGAQHLCPVCAQRVPSDRIQEVPQTEEGALPKPKTKGKSGNAQGWILAVLKAGHSPINAPSLQRSGKGYFSPGGISNALSQLMAKGLIKRVGVGSYTLSDQAIDSPPSAFWKPAKRRILEILTESQEAREVRYVLNLLILEGFDMSEKMVRTRMHGLAKEGFLIKEDGSPALYSAKDSEIQTYSPEMLKPLRFSILEILKESGEPKDMRFILGQLAESGAPLVTERTVRNETNRLVAEGLLLKELDHPALYSINKKQNNQI